MSFLLISRQLPYRHPGDASNHRGYQSRPSDSGCTRLPVKNWTQFTRFMRTFLRSIIGDKDRATQHEGRIGLRPGAVTKRTSSYSGRTHTLITHAHTSSYSAYTNTRTHTLAHVVYFPSISQISFAWNRVASLGSGVMVCVHRCRAEMK